MGNRRDLAEGWLSPLSRNLMLIIGYGLAIGSLLVIRLGISSGSAAMIVAGVACGFLGWLISALVPDPVPAPRKSLRRRAAMLARVGGHQLP
jgi:hypothetical protein